MFPTSLWIITSWWF